MYKNMQAAKRERRYGPLKIYGIRIVLPLTQEMLSAIDESLGDTELRLDFIRAAIERELKRRHPR